MRYSKLLLAVSCLLVVLLSSCEKDGLKDTAIQPQEKQYSDNMSKVYIDQLSAMGFSIEELLEYEEYFIVEGDMVIYKSDIKIGSSRQRSTTHLVASAVAQNIRVRIHASISGWTDIIEDAIEQWNDVNANLQFTISNTSPHITIYADDDPACPTNFRDLAINVCGRGATPTTTNQPGAVISINVDQRSLTTDAERLRTITHEFGHTVGLGHTNDVSSDLINDTPVTDNNSLMNSGECGRTIRLSDQDANALCELYPMAHISSGSSNDLDRYRTRYATSLASGKTMSDVVAFAIAQSNNRCFVWYRDGTYSHGNSVDLDRNGSGSYSLAPGRSSDDIAGIGIASNNHFYVWYKDGTVSSGTHNDLDRYRSLYSYSVASGRSHDDIVGIGIATNNRCYAWYKDGTYSHGNSIDLDRNGSGSYTVAPEESSNYIKGVAIANNNRCYVLYK